MQITIHTPTSNLESSIEFYSKLNFKQVSKDPACFTDGIALVEINPDRFARAGIKCYGGDWKSSLDMLQMLTPAIRTGDGFLCADPSGVWIYLSEEDPPVDFIQEKTCFSTLGNFAGMSLETTDMERSLAVYQALGFQISGGSPEAGYLSLSLGNFGISLMRPLSCPHLFFNPSMTYFNGGKNLEVIEKIRAAGISIAEEITQFNKEGIADNVIIRDPGGYGFFIFND